jgi:2-polyprenyl-6-methoxyphenol hydroxylase-like FAD-dependent oxidoreductase
MYRTSVVTLIVGAGPSGLVLANVLTAFGAPVRIVDRKPGPVPQSRAAIVHIRTLELLDRLGLKDRAVARGVPVSHVEVYQRGRPAARVPLSAAAATAASATPLVLTQDRTEHLLADGLAERGGRVEWNTELVALDGTAAVLRGPGGAEERVAARWVVGADGAGSRVRRALALEFSGKTYEQTGLLADVELDRPPTAGTVRLNLTRGGFVGVLGLGDGRYRLFGALPPGLVPPDTGDEVSHDPYAAVSLADIQRWFDDLFAIDATVTSASWTALFTIHSRMVRRFRVGNTFLIGDAAHVHSPAGGQGMNLGIGDAVNLGWKLGLVAAGRAHERLLDSYEAERLPVARTVLQGTDRGFALETTDSPVGVWFRAHVAPRLVGPFMRLPPVRNRMVQLFAQTWIRYPRSPIVSGRHAGDRAEPGLAPADLDHHVLVPDRDTGDRVKALLGENRLGVRVHVRPATDRRVRLVRLIRPDGHVGYAGPAAGLPAHLERVYGPVP